MDVEEVYHNTINEYINSSNKDSVLKDFIEKHISSDKLNYILEQLKWNGNQAFHAKKYQEAIDNYVQCLAATKDKPGRSALQCNISAAYLNLNKLDEALEYAREAITNDPFRDKPWFRAAQVFEKKGNYQVALSILQAAQKKSVNTNIQEHIQRILPFAIQEKNVERITVDYSRFENIDDETPTLEVTEQENVPYQNIEFAEGTTEEQKKQLTALLTGVVEPTQTQKSTIRLSFKYQELISIKEYYKNTKIMKALQTLLRANAEIRGIKTIIENDLMNLNNSALKTQISSINAQPQDSNRKTFFLGSGSGICLISYLKNYSEKVTVCTNHIQPYYGWMLDRMFQVNDITENVSLLNKPLRDLKFSTGNKKSHLLDEHIYDISEANYSNLIIDLNSFDSSGVGYNICKDIHFARRNICVQNDENTTSKLRITPNSMQIWMHAVKLKNSDYVCPEFRDLFQKGMWNLCFEPAEMNKFYPVSESVLIKTYVFDGPLSKLETDCPLNFEEFYQFNYNNFDGEKENIIHGWVVNCRLKFFKDLDHYVWRHGLAKPGILVLPPRKVSNQFQAKVSLKNALLRVDIDEPCKSVLKYHIPNWHRSVIYDSHIAQSWVDVTSKLVKAKMNKIISAIDRKRIQLDKVNMEILIFDSLFGLLPAVCLQEVAKIIASRGSRPTPVPHITCIEPSESTEIIANSYIYQNKSIELLDETTYIQKPEIKWNYFVEKPTALNDKKPDAVEIQKIQAKIKTRFTSESKNFCALRSPVEDSSNIMLLAKLTQASRGADGKPIIPPANPKDVLPSLANIFINRLYDAALYGDGYIPSQLYGLRALSKSNCTVAFTKARICGALVELGRNYENVDSYCWIGLFGGSVVPHKEMDYQSANINELYFTQLSEPQALFEIDAENPEKFEGVNEVEWNAKSLIDGNANAIIYWVDLIFNDDEEIQGMTTCPSNIKGYPLHQNGAAVWNQLYELPKYRTQYHNQAFQLLGNESLYFMKGDEIYLKSISQYTRLFTIWNKDKITDYNIRRMPSAVCLKNDAMISQWQGLLTTHNEHLNKLMQIYTDRKTAETVCKTLCEMIMWNENADEDINLNGAQRIFLSFFA